jgi:hypothetical protein
LLCLAVGPGVCGALAVILFAACASRGESAPAAPPLETAIARELTARFHVPVTARCAAFGSAVLACRAELDGVVLPIALAEGGWHVVGRFVDTTPIAAYVQGVLDDLGVAQHASCLPHVQQVAPGARVGCTLSGGGAAFVDVAGDGSLALELALDPAAAAVRAEPATEDRVRDLVQRSRGLDRGDTDDSQ